MITGWDNRNPRASGLRDNLKQRLDARSYARYERAEGESLLYKHCPFQCLYANISTSPAAHYNSLESFPLYAACILVGNLVKIENDQLNTFALGIGLLRAAYIVSYIVTERQKYTPIRSAIWIASLSWMLRFLWKAASKAV